MALNDQQMLEEDTVIHVVKTGETLKNIAKVTNALKCIYQKVSCK